MAGNGLRLGAVKLRASLHETIWGGRTLATLAGKQLPADTLIGEAWETALDAVAATPPFTGATLGELVDRYGEALIGAQAVAIYGMRFPLLTKFIDANQWLSVQVHPNDSYAAAHEGGKLGKTETWYILHAAPDAQIVYGMRAAATPDKVRAAIAANRLEDLLHTVPVQTGDVVFVPAGMVHAIGAGVALYELQEYSDVTYRLYDYGRVQANGQPRELHVEQGLTVMRYEPPAVTRVMPITAATTDTGAPLRRTLAACRYFILDELTFDGAFTDTARPASVQIISVLEGSCAIASATDDEHSEERDDADVVMLGLGETAILPAAMDPCILYGDHARLARSYVPEEDDAALLAWRAAQAVAFDV
ncbi:MAG: type I phosphomannose isomerase catalytic subunit [Ktedonobacterales bacterium]